MSDSDMPRILVITDDPAAGRMMVRYFEEHSLRAETVSRRQIMASQPPASSPPAGSLPASSLVASAPSLVILDLRASRPESPQLLRDIRARSGVPLIVTAGHHCGEMDRAAGLELGADDCLTEPFGLRELLARVRAVLRRQVGHAAPTVTREPAGTRGPDRGGYRFGGWQLDRRTRRVTDPAGCRVTLTKSEYALLIAFLDAPGRPLSRAYLLRATRMHEDIGDRSIDAQVLRLRRKLETDPAVPRIFKTERGVGYLFALPVEEVGQRQPDLVRAMRAILPGRSHPAV